MSVGNDHLVGLTSGGRVLFAGKPEYEGADQVDGWSRIRYIACGERSTYAIDPSGKIRFCGSDVPDFDMEIWGGLLG